MHKPVRVVLKGEAVEYLKAQPPEIRKKFATAFRKTENGFHGEWLVKMPGTDDLYEFKVSGKNNFPRLLAFWDSSQEAATLIIVTHGFDKKTNKTPKGEIEKAERVKKEHTL